MIINRVRRFCQYINTKNSPADLSLVEFFLPVRLAALFFSMAAADQKHCLATAKTALKLAQKSDKPVDEKLLVQAALLHDVGRRAGDMAIWQRVLAVLLDACWSNRGRGLANKDRPRGSFSFALYIYYNHPARGAYFIRQAGGGDALANLAALHHSRRAGSPELTILRAADELN